MEQIGIGNTAEVFAYEKNKICKLFYIGYPRACVEREYMNSKLVNKLQIPSPEAYELIEMDGRDGIIYERLAGEVMLNQLLKSADPSELVLRMVNLQKAILEKQSEECMDYKEFLRGLLVGKDADASIPQQIDALPDGKQLCHGDYHPGNVWVQENGELQVIDFMNICHGPKEYDIARTYFLITEGGLPDGISEEQKVQIRQMQLALGTQYLQLMQVTKETIQKYINVIAACRIYEA